MKNKRKILEWPHKLAKPRLLARFSVPGEPMSKQRPRTTVKNGKTRTYTPGKTRQAEEKILACYLQDERRLVPDDHTRLGVRIFFYKKNHIRRDVDNMAKLVLDALNKMAWHDDAQVDELILFRELDVANPRTEVVVYIV
jgi:Holliday junction resolvase RusA-like endonuclease